MHEKKIALYSEDQTSVLKPFCVWYAELSIFKSVGTHNYHTSLYRVTHFIMELLYLLLLCLKLGNFSAVLIVCMEILRSSEV